MEDQGCNAQFESMEDAYTGDPVQALIMGSLEMAVNHLAITCAGCSNDCGYGMVVYERSTTGPITVTSRRHAVIQGNKLRNS